MTTMTRRRSSDGKDNVRLLRDPPVATVAVVAP
jgi:hypothetical protein